MFNDRLIHPTGSQIRYLKDISNGSLSFSVTKREVTDLYDITHDEDEDYNSLLKMICLEHITALKNSKVYYHGWIEIDKPEQIDDDTWGVAVFTTDHLLEIIACLNRGVIWNIQHSKPDYELTEKEWRAHLNRRSVPDYVFEIVNRNSEPELQQIRAEFVLFKLTANKGSDGHWRKQENAA